MHSGQSTKAEGLLTIVQATGNPLDSESYPTKGPILALASNFPAFRSFMYVAALNSWIPARWGFFLFCIFFFIFLLGVFPSSAHVGVLFCSHVVCVRGPPVGSHLYGLSYSIFTSSSTSILKPFILNPHISHLPHCSLVSCTARNLWQPALLSF